MKPRLHGVFSLPLFGAAIAVALITLWQKSPWTGFLYLSICALSSCGILFAYCAKCKVRLANCSHVFPGKLTRVLPRRKQGPYTIGDVAGTVLFLGLILLFPQYWLLKHVAFLILFWAFVAAAVAEILVFVCPRCENRQCMMCPKGQMPEDRAPEA